MTNELVDGTPERPPAWDTMDTLDYHQSMILDRNRVRAFRDAVDHHVHPGDVVLDLGCGIGLLACLAAQAGARQVYAIEEGPIAEVALHFIFENGFGDRVEMIRGLSTAVELPEAVDVVVSETIGNMGFDEGIVEWINDAHDRFLRPGGIVIPQRVETLVAAVEIPADYDFVDGWSGDHHGFDFSAIRRAARGSVFWTDLSPRHVVTAPEVCFAADLTAPATTPLSGRVELTARRSAEIHGIGAWFRADMGTDHILSNQPPSPVPSWSQVVLPIEQPLAVQKGDRLAVELEGTTTGYTTAWSIQVFPGPARRDLDSGGAVLP
ncbi:MAG: 50S ribosomal protein L11 methyltransferase [Acidimicrobiales bacterium]